MLNLTIGTIEEKKQRREVIAICCDVYAMYARYRHDMLFFQNRGARSTGVKSANRQLIRLLLHLGPDILLVLTMKRQVLHRERAHLKVPGCSLVLSALLTKKLPTFLSRLNEISGGCEKILPVSGSFWSNLKLLRMILLTA